jgi:hypothetical protein
MQTYTVTMKYGAKITGILYFEKYMDGSPALLLEDEILSINLAGYDLRPDEGCVFVKNYSEHEGLPDALVAAGIAEKVREVSIGNFGSSCWLMRVTGETVND